MNIPVSIENSAFFFDFDGTLVELASTPDNIIISPSLILLLQSIQTKVNGSMAIVSGRSLDVLDNFLKPLKFAASGVHGTIQRDINGFIMKNIADYNSSRNSILLMHKQLKNYLDNYKNYILIEDKSIALAVHYYAKPSLKNVIYSVVRKVLLPYLDRFTIQVGKMVIEIKPYNSNKGTAIKTFMSKLPFNKRTPVFIGDDDTDEIGFMTVNQLNGISIKIGKGKTIAKYRIASVESCINWLTGLILPIN